MSSLREAIILESHAGGLASHFGRDKTLVIIQEQFYWPRMGKDVSRILEKCRACHIAKTHGNDGGLYKPLSYPETPWQDISLDFVLGLPELNAIKTRSWWLSTVSLKWLTLFLVLKPLMQAKLPDYTFLKLSSYTVSQNHSPLIGM